ncbi:MAG: ribonuclease HII [Solirubrobacteraceae bacterium]
MANQTTAGSGAQSRRAGSSASPSRPTGRRTASASSERGDAPGPRASARAAKRSGKRRSSAKLFRFDRALGARLVAGADEAGRGCLAGPLVAAAVLFDCDALARGRARGLSELDDSKRCTEEARERLHPLILASARSVFVVSRSAQTIDANGLHRTNIAALEAALRGVVASAQEPALCLADGFQLRGLRPSPRQVIGGDRTSAAIAAASIVAKVTRDRLMRHADALHPGWGFAQHVGYATPEHRAAIRRLGVSPLHRLSFQSAAYGEQLRLEDTLVAETLVAEAL